LPEIGREGDEPEEERRLVSVNLSIVMHQNPIPAVHHLSRHLGIPGFVRIPEIPLVQINEKKKEAETNEKKDLDPFLRINLRKPSLHVTFLIG
jgi:hypothetical protein